MVKPLIAPLMDVVGNLSNEGYEEEVSKTSDDSVDTGHGHGLEDGSDDEEADSVVAAAVDVATKSAARGNGGSGGNGGNVNAAQQHKCSVRGCTRVWMIMTATFRPSTLDMIMNVALRLRQALRLPTTKAAVS